MHAPHDKARAEQAKPPMETKKPAGSMKRWLRTEFATVALVAGAIALAGGAAWWAASGGGASAQQKGMPPRVVSVFTAPVTTKDMPYRIEAIGAVQPVVSVAVRSRVDSQIEKVNFEDGAMVKAGDVLFVLDSRSIDAQIRQSEATLSRDQAQLEKATRDLERTQGLVERNALSQVQLADARTNTEVLKATVAQDEAQLQNLRVLRTYYDIRSPATGRIGLSAVRTGAVVRAGSDTAAPLATVNQLSPIYVAFGVSERYIPDLRAAGDNARVDATLPGGVSVTGGKIAFIDNTVDSQSATIMVRASFDNKDERLWPGNIATVRVTLRIDPKVVVVPSEAVQSGQRGTFVFVVDKGAAADKGVAKVRQVTVARTLEGEAIIQSGLAAGETVVTDGQLSLRDGSRVDIKRPAGS